MKQTKAVYAKKGYDEMGRTDRISPSQATPSSLSFTKTVYFTDHKGRPKSLTAEVDMGSFCMIITQDYLAENLPNALVELLKDLACTYSRQPIHNLKGTVDLCACCAGQTVSTRVYMGVYLPTSDRVGPD